jgi:putative phage-type endonuclease
MSTTLTAQLNREEWLAARRQGIGASDAAAAVGLSKWCTPLELYLIKRGELETTENEPMRWGTALEPVIRQEYANRTGRTVILPGLLRHPRIEFALATPDGIADGDRLLEVKTARTAQDWGEPGTNEIPTEYMLQVQHALAVVGLVVCDVAVLVGGQDFRLYEVEADHELQEMLFDQEAEFWRRVREGDPPEPSNRDDVRRRWRYSSGLSVKASQEVLAMVAELKRLREVVSQEDAKCEALAAAIQQYMAEASELVAENGAPLATWKNVKANPRFDLERFREEQPELWAQYLRDPQPQRRFLLKTKGE